MSHWKREFYKIWTGQAFSQLSSSILQFAIVWYLTDTTKSGMVLSLAMLVGFLPQGVLGLFIGVYIDRFHRKMIMIASDLLIAGASLLLVVTSVNGSPSTELVLVVLLIRAIGTAFHTPTLQAVTPQLVPAEQLSKCAGYTQSLQSISMILSPALAAFLYSVWSIGAIVLLDVAGAIVASVLVALSHIPLHEKAKKKAEQSVFREAVEGFQILYQNKGMFGLVLISSLYTVALMPVSALFPLMCMGYFKGTSVHASVVEIVFAVGFLIGSVILGKWGGTKKKITTIMGSYMLMTVCLVGSGLLPPYAFVWFVVLAFLMGISGPFYWGMYTPLLQQTFKEEYLGRVMSITGSVRLISGPLALMISGTITEFAGEETWFLIAGGLVLVATILVMTIPVVRNCEQRSDSTETASPI